MNKIDEIAYEVAKVVSYMTGADVHKFDRGHKVCDGDKVLHIYNDEISLNDADKDPVTLLKITGCKLRAWKSICEALS